MAEGVTPTNGPEKRASSEPRGNPGLSAGPGTAVPPRIGYGYSGAASAQRDRPLREYLNIIIQFRLLIIILSASGAGIGVNINKSRPIFFESSAMVNIGAYVPPTDGPTADIIKAETSRSEYLDNQLPILKSYTIAKKVLANDPVVRRFIQPSYNPETANSSSNSADTSGAASVHDLSTSEGDDIPVYLLDMYLSMISTFHQDGTTLISISSTTSSAEISARLANAHAKAFMELIRQQRMIWATVNVDFLRKRYEEVSARAAESDRALVEYARKNSINLIDKNRIGDAHAERFQSLIANLSETVLERNSLQQQIRQRRQSINAQGVSLDDRSWPILPRLNQLQNEYDKAIRQRRGQFYTNDLQNEIRNIKSLLRQNAGQSIRDLETKLTGTEEKERLLRNEFNALKRSESGRAEEILEFTVLERTATAAKEQLIQIQARLEEAAVNAESDQKTVSLVDAAVPPSGPISQKKVSAVVSGMLFGALLGIGIAFLFDYQRAAIRTVSDLALAIDAPVLGAIPVFGRGSGKSAGDYFSSPRSRASVAQTSAFLLWIERFFASSVKRQHVRSDAFTGAFEILIFNHEEIPGEQLEVGNKKKSLLIVTQPNSRESEAFRSIRATIKFSRKEGPPKLLLVTSGQKGDGKSTVAVNLAASLAQTSARTLIIDSDLRMPTVHTHFEVDRNHSGLADYLMNPGRLSDFLLSCDVPYLSVMVAGSAVSNPSELIGSRRMLDLLERAAEEFDHVIIDTPPVGEIADALLICRAVDGVLVVARSGITPKAVAQLAATRLNQVRAKIIGTTLNGLKPSDGYGDGYKSNYYYNR